MFVYIYLRNLAWICGKYSSTMSVLDTFYVKYFTVHKIHLHFALSVLSKYKKLDYYNIFIGSYANKFVLKIFWKEKIEIELFY